MGFSFVALHPATINAGRMQATTLTVLTLTVLTTEALVNLEPVLIRGTQWAR